MQKYWRGGPHNHNVNSLVVCAGVQAVANRSTTALPLFLVLVHGVLKCAHHPVAKYVILRHPAASSQDFLHCSRLETITDDFFRATSPAAWLHLALVLPCSHVHLSFDVVVVVVVVVVVITLVVSVISVAIYLESKQGAYVHVSAPECVTRTHAKSVTVR